MHIEPGIVQGAKIALSVVTAAGSLAFTAKLAFDAIKTSGLALLATRSIITTVLVFCFFEVLPHHPVGVSEVHLILGSTLFLLFGAPAAMIGLAAGLLLQGALFAPLDLPQYGINVTTLLVPLYGMNLLAKRIIPTNTAYKDITYKQALALSTVFQGGIVSWVGFWALYGQGLGTANLTQVAVFGSAYMLIVILEPLVDLGVLVIAKNLHRFKVSELFVTRMYTAVA